MFDNNDTIRNKQKTGNNAKEEKRNNDKTTAKAAAVLGAALDVGGADCRCSYRFGQSPTYSHNHYGFRLALSQ